MNVQLPLHPSRLAVAPRQQAPVRFGTDSASEPNPAKEVDSPPLETPANEASSFLELVLGGLDTLVGAVKNFLSRLFSPVIHFIENCKSYLDQHVQTLAQTPEHYQKHFEGALKHAPFQKLIDHLTSEKDLPTFNDKDILQKLAKFTSKLDESNRPVLGMIQPQQSQILQCVLKKLESEASSEKGRGATTLTHDFMQNALSEAYPEYFAPAKASDKNTDGATQVKPEEQLQKMILWNPGPGGYQYKKVLVHTPEMVTHQLYDMISIANDNNPQQLNDELRAHLPAKLLNQKNWLNKVVTVIWEGLVTKAHQRAFPETSVVTVDPEELNERNTALDNIHSDDWEEWLKGLEYFGNVAFEKYPD